MPTREEIRERILPDSVVNRAINIIIEKNLEVFKELDRIDRAGKED